MILYFAGVTLTEGREEVLIKYSVNRLLTFCYHREGGMAEREAELRFPLLRKEQREKRGYNINRDASFRLGVSKVEELTDECGQR